MNRFISKLVFIAITASWLSSCAQTFMVSSWISSPPPKAKYHKILVVSLAQIPEDRQIIENAMVNDLIKRGVEAMPGYQHFVRYTNQDFGEAARKAGADGLLTVQTISIGQKTQIEPDYNHPYVNYWSNSAFATNGLYESDGATIFMEPLYTTTLPVATIQVMLKDVKNGGYVWTATMESYEPNKVAVVGKTVAKLTSHELAKDKLLSISPVEP